MNSIKSDYDLIAKKCDQFFLANPSQKIKMIPAPSPVSYLWLTQISRLPILELDINFDPAAILSEVKSIDHLFQEDPTVTSTGWYTLQVKGNAFFRYEKDDSQVLETSWHPVLQQLPSLKKILDLLPIAPTHLYILRLDPGGRVAPHRDKQTFALDKLILPISYPKASGFVVKDWGPQKLTPGRAYLFDDGQLHSTWNNSEQSRYHIHVSCDLSLPQMRSLILNSFTKFKSGEQNV